MADLTEVELAYAAGIIDGEGCIGISEYSPNGKDRKSSQFRCSLTVAMTDPIIPNLLAGWFEGTTHSYEGRKPGHKGVTIWKLQNQRASACCKLLLPYLRLKNRQAELLVAFYDDPRFLFTRRQGVPEEEILGKREYTTEIRALNKRGVPVGGQ